MPLTHPGRDRTSGRIWRVVYKGDDPATKPRQARSSGGDTWDNMKFGPLTSRLEGMLKISDKAGLGVFNPADSQRKNESDLTTRMLLLWLTENEGRDDDDLLSEEWKNESPLVRTHIMRILAEREEWNDRTRALAVQGLRDPDPFVSRAAADALGRHPHASQVRPLASQLIRRASR